MHTTTSSIRTYVAVVIERPTPVPTFDLDVDERTRRHGFSVDPYEVDRDHWTEGFIRPS